MDPNFPGPDFDVNTLLVSLTSPEQNLVIGQVPLEYLEQTYQNRLRLAILFGVRVGAAVLTLIAMHLVTKKNRTKILFLANQMSLIFLIVHAALYFRFLLGRFASVLMMVTFRTDPRGNDAPDTSVSVATNVFVLLMICSVQVSLAVQTRSVFHAWLKSRIYITVALIVLSLVVFTFWTIHTVVSYIALTQPHRNMRPMAWTRLASDVSFACSISTSSLVLVAKLVMAIRARKTLGKKPLGYTKVLIIMSTQSLVVPAILIITNYALPAENSWILSGVAYLLVVLSLPLSSIWATSVNEDEMQSTYMRSALNNGPVHTEKKFKQVFLNRLRPFSTFTTRDEDSSSTHSPAMPSPESDITFLNTGFEERTNEKAVA
ncbi:Pheromone alpha factor receptor [Yarrowia sp. C11]|nr:Pheromone alpha factor receptor [Yarrowia sp. C11]